MKERVFVASKSRNGFGVKDQSDCYRTIRGTVCVNAQDVCEQGDHLSIKEAAQALAREYKAKGYLTKIELQDEGFYRVFVEYTAFYDKVVTIVQVAKGEQA